MVDGIGNVQIMSKVNKNNVQITLEEGVLAPKMTHNVDSYSQDNKVET